MNNNRTQIFIASSAELSAERDLCSLLIFDLSGSNRDRDCPPLFPIRWEEMDAAVRYHRHKNTDYEREVKKSELFIGLFWTKCGQYTLDELTIALEGKKAGLLPHEVAIFIKVSSEQQTEAVRAQLTELTGDMCFYYFSHEDELKEQLLRVLIAHLKKQNLLPTPDIHVEGDYLCVNGEIVVDCSQLPVSACELADQLNA